MLLQLGAAPICYIGNSANFISIAEVRSTVCGASAISAVAFPVPLDTIDLSDAKQPVFITDNCFDAEIPYNCTQRSLCSQPAIMSACTMLAGVNCSARPVVQAVFQDASTRCASDADAVPALLVNITPVSQLGAGYVCAATLSIPGAQFFCRSLGFPGYQAMILTGQATDPAMIYYNDFSCLVNASSFADCTYSLSLSQTMCVEPAIVRCGEPPCRFQPTDVFGAFCERVNTPNATRKMLYIQQNSTNHCVEIVYAPNALDVKGLAQYASNLTFQANRSNSIYPLFFNHGECDMVTPIFEQPFLAATNATVDTYYSLSFTSVAPSQETLYFDGCVQCPSTAPVGFYCGGLTGGLYRLDSAPSGDTISIWRDMYDRSQVVCLNARIRLATDPTDTNKCKIELIDLCPGYSASQRVLYFDGFTQSIAAFSPQPASQLLAFYSLCPEPPTAVCPPFYAPLTNLSMCGVSAYDSSRTVQVTFLTDSLLAFSIEEGGLLLASCTDVQYTFSLVSVGCTLIIPDMVSLDNTCSRSSPLWGQFQFLASATLSSTSPPTMVFNLLNDTISFSDCRTCPDYSEQHFCGDDGETALLFHKATSLRGTFVLSGNVANDAEVISQYEVTTIPQCFYTLNTTLTLPILMPRDAFTFCLLASAEGVASCDSVPQKQKIMFRQCLMPPVLPLVDYCSSSMHLKLSLRSPMLAVLTDEHTGFSLAVPYAVLAKNRSFILNGWSALARVITGLKGSVPLQVVFQPSSASFLWYFGDGYQYMSAAACQPSTLVTLLLDALNGLIVLCFVTAVVVVNVRSRRTATKQKPLQNELEVSSISYAEGGDEEMAEGPLPK